MGFRITILLQQLSPSGSGVNCPQPQCSGPGKHVPCYSRSWCNPGRHVPQENGLSICFSEKQKSAFCIQHSRHLSQIRAGFGRFLHSFISYFLTTPGCMAKSPYFMAPFSWLPSQSRRCSFSLTTDSMVESQRSRNSSCLTIDSKAESLLALSPSPLILNADLGLPM